MSGAAFWTPSARPCERFEVRAWGLSMALWGCASGCVESEPAHAAVEQVQDAGPAVRARPPWLIAPDPLDQSHPAYGITLYHMANLLEAPRRDARVLGYLRRGARFRASEEVSREGCLGGWFEAHGGGYVCHGEGATVDSSPPPYEDAPSLPALGDPLPYRYLKVMRKDLPQFLRLPTVEEEEAVTEAFARFPETDAGPLPVGALSPTLTKLVRARMQPGFYVSVDKEVRDEASGRAFVRTVRGGWLRAETLKEVKVSRGIGVALGGRMQLPLAFVYRPGTPPMRVDPVSGELIKAGDNLPVHQAHALTGEVVQKAGRRFFVTREGLLLRDAAVRVIERVPRPKHTGRREKWIRVDLDRQTLTAYDGEAPVFTTLVSSGLPDHETPTGVFRLHAKHVATTMADELAADGPYSIEDVPWTMYFVGGYALHAAFWHDRFGNTKSHGCVNLSPRDARWLFYWSAPDLPPGWHGAQAAIGKGTVITLDAGSVYAIEQGG